MKAEKDLYIAWASFRNENALKPCLDTIHSIKFKVFAHYTGIKLVSKHLYLFISKY